MENNEQKILDDLQAARQFYTSRDYPKAIEIYTRLADLLKDEKENLAVILIELAWSYYQHQEYASAIDCLEKAIQNGRLDQQQLFDCYRLIGFSLQMLNQRPEAIRYLKKAVGMEIAETVKRFSYFELGKIFFMEGQMMEAEHYFTAARSLFAEQEKSYIVALAFYQGFINYFQKNYPQARQHFAYIIQHAEDNKTKASGFFGMAHLYYQEKKFPVVIDICEKIMRLDETFYDKESLGYFLCESYLHLKDWENLESFFTELQTQYPNGRYRKEYPKFAEALKHRRLSQK